MSTESESSPKWTKNTLERHAQTVLVLILVALLLWVGQTTQDTSLAVARLQVEVAFLRQEVTRPNAAHAEYERRLNTLEEDSHRHDK